MEAAASLGVFSQAGIVWGQLWGQLFNMVRALYFKINNLEALFDRVLGHQSRHRCHPKKLEPRRESRVSAFFVGVDIPGEDLSSG